jgi:hypothetical protein
MAETAWSSASVIQTMTAKASTASIRWPAMERPSGVGSNMTATKAATASRTPQFERNQVGFAGDGALAPAGLDIVSMVAMKFRPRRSICFAVEQIWRGGY